MTRDPALSVRHSCAPQGWQQLPGGRRRGVLRTAPWGRPSALFGGPCASLPPPPGSSAGLGMRTPRSDWPRQVGLGTRYPGRLGVLGRPAITHWACLTAACCSKHDPSRDGPCHPPGGGAVDGDGPDSGVCVDVVLLRFGGMAEDACKALRARPLTSEARQPEPLPCAVCWALYLGPACTCGSGGPPEQFLAASRTW